MTPTGLPETPFMLEGDYTPDTGVMYKVVIAGDTCFVVIDSLDEDLLQGYYYQLSEGCEVVRRCPFTYDRHWRNQRRDAEVYIYQEPEYYVVDDRAYRKPLYKDTVMRDIEYGKASGYYTSWPDTQNDTYLELMAGGMVKSLFRGTKTLTMDIYRPMVDGISEYRLPLVMLMHGGAFLVGDKSDSLITSLCHHFASMGYVAVSINYRIGFKPTKGEIASTGYAALQDAHAAMRYLVTYAEVYGIDTSLLFVGGASAGSITALNLAFMRDKDRPNTVLRNAGEWGDIASSGNSSRATFHIKAVANMWGAITNLNMLKNSRTDIVSFHGDADQVVPYSDGFPFSDISTRLGKRMFDKMYGSEPIDKRARELGYHSVLYPFLGQGHSLHRSNDGSWNQKNYEFIRDKITDFFYEEVAGPTPTIESDGYDTRHYLLSDSGVSEVCWKVEGGFIVKLLPDGNEIWVVWDEDAPIHRLYASGLNNSNFGFNTHRDITILK